MVAAPYFVVDLGVSPPPAKATVNRGDWLKTFGNRISANFDAAQTSPQLERWWANADVRGPNSSIRKDVRFKLAQRARYECRNNTYLNALVELSKLYVINKGPSLLLPTLDTQTAKLVQTEYMRWARGVKLAAKLRTMIAAKKIAGAGLAEKVTNPQLRSPVKLDLRLLEIEYIQDINAEETMDPLWQGGILHDEVGNPVSYRRLKEHPGSLTMHSSAYEYDDVPSDRMIHWYREDRPDQKNGVCEIASTLPIAAEMRRYTLATVAHAETASAHAGVVYSDTQFSDDLVDFEDDLTRIDLEHRALLTLPKGWRMGQFSSSTHTASFKEFRTALLEEISRATLAPLNMLSGNSRDANFASAQMDHMVWDMVCEIEQQDCECQVMDDIFLSWLQEARLIPDYLPPVPVFVPPMWRWPAAQSVDALKQARTDLILWQLGLLTDEAYFDKHNIDAEEHYASLERQTERRLGIDPAFPQPGQRDQPAFSAAMELLREESDEGENDTEREASDRAAREREGVS